MTEIILNNYSIEYISMSYPINKNILNSNTLLIVVIITLCVIFLLPQFLYALAIVDTYHQIQTTFEGLSKFLNSIYTVVSTITSILGYRAIALFFAIAVTSAGLSAIGFPKGKTTFFIAFIIDNILWYTWNKSFGIDYTTTALTMLKTNAVIVFPYIIFIIIKRYALQIKHFFIQIFHMVLPSHYKKKITKNALSETINSLHSAYATMMSSIMNDLIHSKDTINLSQDTIATIEHTETILKKIKETGDKQ